jgi:predicted GNAT family acetyltransferase
MFINNKNLQRFERPVDGHIVYAAYRIDGDVLYINYVEAPEALRGHGEAGKLMADIAAYVRTQSGMKIIPICGYAASWLRRHPEHADLLMP